MSTRSAVKSIYRSVNPVTNTLFHEAQLTSDSEVDMKLERAYQWFMKNRHHGQEGVEQRFDKLTNVHALLG